MSETLLVVVVNYRTGDLTVDCLRTLGEELAQVRGSRAVVVDNDSGDGSAEQIAGAIEVHGWGSWVSLLRAERNGGFSYGNNVGIRPALDSSEPPQFVLLLNPDTLVRPGAIRELMAFVATNPNIAIAGSRLEDPDGTPQRSAFRFHTLLSELNGGLRLGLIARLFPKSVIAPPVSDEPCRAEWVAGASMLVRGELFRTIGVLDEAYFMYFEEVDFCLRAVRAGFECWYVPASHVVHLVGQASGVTDPNKVRKRRPAYWFESRRRYFVKNHGFWYAVATDLAFLTGYVIFQARRVVQRKPDVDPDSFLMDFLRHSVLLRGPKP
jgi:N-acetylglucosaminyl-diphospho-decaprenol L-rhamnosyltransferase